MKSPCIKVCVIVDTQGKPDYCIGCFRTLDEIARWSRLTDTEKQSILDLLPQRKQKAMI